jgi:HlyD family secretion protein
MLRLPLRSAKAGGGTAVAVADQTDVLPLAVLEFQSPTAGVIARPVPAAARYTTWYLTALIASLLLVAAVKKIDKQVPATGVLVSSAPDSVIEAFASSIVESVDVHEGDIVTKGQVLAKLDKTVPGQDLTSLTTQEQGYAAQVAQLQAQENGTPYQIDPQNPASVLQYQTYTQQENQYNFTMQDYAAKIRSLQSQIAGYKQQAAVFAQRLAISEEQEGMYKKLYEQNVGSLINLQQAEDAVKTIQADLENAEAEARSGAQDLAAQEAERDSFAQQFHATTSTQLAQAEQQLAQTQAQLAQAKFNADLVVLTAPQDAIVQSINGLSVGSVVQTGQNLMTLVPLDAPLSVEADLDSTQSGYVKVGDPVEIKFNTLPFLQYGNAQGRVTQISPESFNPLQENNPSLSHLPGGPQDLYFKMQVSLDVLNLHNTTPGFRLVPGMPLEADVKTGTRTILGFFTQRLLPVAYDSLHEP